MIQGVEPRVTRLIDLADAVAGDEVTGGGFLEFRRLAGTALAGIGAAGAEGLGISPFRTMRWLARAIFGSGTGTAESSDLE